MGHTLIDRRDFLKVAAAASGFGLIEFSPMSLLAARSGSGLQDGWIPTTCHMCGGTTGVLAHVVNGRVVKIEPNSENPVGIANISTDFHALKRTGARMCPKGNAAIMSLYDPDRVKRPLKRLGERGSGQWQEISYDQAIVEIASRLAAIRSSAGPDRVLWFGEDASFTAMQENFCNAFGTPNYFIHSSLCDVSRKAAFLTTMGIDRPLPDLRNTRFMLIFGWNPLGAMKWAHLPRILLDGLARGAKAVVVDPRCSETAEKALAYGGQWLPIRPGTDGALALALAHVIIREGRQDTAFIANWSVGFDEFKAIVADKTPEWGAAITGIPAETIAQVARDLATTKPAVIDVWSGPGQHVNGTEGSRAIAMLAGLIGQIDQPGSLMMPSRKGPKFGMLPKPALPRIDGAKTKYPFAHSSGVYVEARDAMLTGQPYQPKAAVFVFQNFVMAVPNTTKNLDALRQLEFIVAIDTHMSETALMADYVLPGTVFLERYELISQWVTFPVVSLRQPVVPPLFGQKPEYDVISDLARQLGHTGYPFNVPYEQYLDDALRAGIGVRLADLQALPGATWIGGETTYRKYESQGFSTPSRKFEFYSEQMRAKGLNPLPDYAPTEDGPTPEHPLYLINWKEALHTHSRTMNNRWLMQYHGDNELWLNVDRARSLGIGEGDVVTVENEYGQGTVRARLTRRIHPDVVGLLHGFGHTGLGPVARGKGLNDALFIPGKADPISGQAAHKDGAVRVRK